MEQDLKNGLVDKDGNPFATSKAAREAKKAGKLGKKVEKPEVTALFLELVGPGNAGERGSGSAHYIFALDAEVEEERPVTEGERRQLCRSRGSGSGKRSWSRRA